MARSGGGLQDLSDGRDDRLQPLDRRRFCEVGCSGGHERSSRLRKEPRRCEAQHDRLRTRRAVDPESRSGVVDRHVPARALGHEENGAASDRWEGDTRGPANLPRAEDLAPADDFVDRPARREYVEVSGRAVTFEVEETFVDADMPRREDQARSPVLHAQRDLGAVAHRNRFVAHTEDRGQHDAIGHFDDVLDRQLPHRRGRKRRRHDADHRNDHACLHGDCVTAGGLLIARPVLR